MVEYNEHLLLLVVSAIIGVITLQFVLFLLTVFAVRRLSKQHHLVNREMYALMRRIEALTSTRREQILKHFDRLLARLSNRLPPTVAVHLSKLIFDTETKILSRLTELEPYLQSNEKDRKKMDELIRSMERLETTLVTITADTVRTVMLESRADLLNDEQFINDHLAA